MLLWPRAVGAGLSVTMANPMRFFRATTALAAFCFGLCAASARADEQLSELTHRGLDFSGAFAQSGLVVEAQDLSIGLQNIEIKYRIANPTSHPVETTLSLPLPDLDFSDPDAAYAIPAPDPANFVALTATIDGAPAPFALAQSARIDARDVTLALRRNNLALIPVGGFLNQLAALAPEARTRLEKDGLIAEIGATPAGDPLYSPRWQVRSVATRTLAIAANKTATIDLRFRASVGATQDTPLREPLRSEKSLAREIDARRAAYCVDQAFFGGIDKIVAAAAPRPTPLAPPADAPSDPLSPPAPTPTPPQPALRVFPEANVAQLAEQRIAFDLAAGAPNQPIHDFRVSVDKGRPDRLVSFCGDNLKKISPTGFEMRKTEFTPIGVLKILLVGGKDVRRAPRKH
jgi:hypothetical protein